MRRLFQPRLDPTAPPTVGNDLGYGRRASRVVITDDDQLDRLRQAETPHDRLVYTFDYLRKVLKNANKQAGDLNDPDTLALLDRIRSELADLLLVSTEELKDVLHARGYGFDGGRHGMAGPRYGSEHPQPAVPAAE